VCGDCGAFFPSARYLEIHVEESHDMYFTLLAKKRQMYQCLVQSCSIKLWSREARQLHLTSVHRFAATFVFDAPRTSHVKSSSNSSTNGWGSNEVSPEGQWVLGGTEDLGDDVEMT